MDCAGSARYLLAVATIAMAISLGCAAPMFNLTLSSPRNTSDSDPTSVPSKLQLPLPEISSIFNTKKDQSPQTSPDNKQQDSQQPPKQQPQQTSPKPTVAEQPGGKDPYQSLASESVTTSPRPKMEMTTHDVHHFIEVPRFFCVQKRLRVTKYDSPKPTLAEQPGGKYPYQSLANASVTTSPRPKMETTTYDIRHFINVPLKKCSAGQVLNKHWKCVAKRERSSNPEDEENSSTILVSTIRRL